MDLGLRLKSSKKNEEHTEATKGTSLFVFRNLENFRLKLEFLRRGIYRYAIFHCNREFTNSKFRVCERKIYNFSKF